MVCFGIQTRSGKLQQWYQCPNCGGHIAFGVRFCGNCGTQLNWPTQQQSPSSQYQQQQTGGWTGYQQPSYRQEIRKPQKRGGNTWLIIGVLAAFLLVAGGIFAVLGNFIEVPRLSMQEIFEPEPIQTPSPAPVPQSPEPVYETDPGAPWGFVKVGNFALAVIGMQEGPSSVYGSKIIITVAIKKLSPPIEDANVTSQGLYLAHIELIDDQGETWQSETIKYGPNRNETTGWKGPIINMRAIPKGFTYITDIRTQAPALALGRIRTIKIVPRVLSAQEVTVVDFTPGAINEIEPIFSIGEKYSAGSWLNIEVLGIIDDAKSLRRQLQVKIDNSSYDSKTYILQAAYQTLDGRIRTTSSNYTAKIEGKSSQIDAVTFETWERQIGELPRVRLYLVSFQTEGQIHFIIVQPD